MTESSVIDMRLAAPFARDHARLSRRPAASNKGMGGSPSAAVERRFAPHQLRHAHALELAREGVPLNIIQRQLGQYNLGTTSIDLQDRPRGRSSPPSTCVGRR